MTKVHLIPYFTILLICSLNSEKCWAQTSPNDYFRSAQSGTWDAANTWESSPDGINNWTPSALAPTADANTITIRSGHSITISKSAAVDQVVVTTGGILELATPAASVLTVNNGVGPDITVESGGIFKHNIGTNSSLPTFTGSATLDIRGGGILEVVNNNGNPSNYANTSSSIASNLIWSDSAILHWNNPSNPDEGITYFAESSAIPIFRISQPVTIGGSNATVINGLLEANGNVSFQGNGSKTFRNGITGTGKVGVTAVNGGQFIINGTTAKLGGAGILELNNNGLMINSGTTLNLTSDKTINNFNGGTGSITNAGTLILGNYIINGNSKIKIDGTVKTTNVNGLTGAINTAFATGLTVSVSASSTVEYNRDGDQAVTPLTYNNLFISGNGVKTASVGSDISVSGAVNIALGCTFKLNGTNHLKLNGGGTLNINVNSIFDTGGESQVSGGGSPTVNIYGTFITRDAQGFTGVNTSIPGAVVNIFPASTIEYGRAGDQAVTSRDDYKNLIFSGSGIKTIPTCNPKGMVTIKDNVIADASNKTFGDSSTNFTMTGGRFKVGGTGTKPDIAGSYNLTGGVIEFTNSGATKETIRSPLTYFNIEVSGSNVSNSSGITTLADGGSFTVKTGGIFENSGLKIDGLAGNQKFILEAGATFLTGVKGGFAGNDSAALKNIETFSIDPKSTIVYNRKGNQTITPQSGYPNLLLKGSGIKTVTGGLVTVLPTADSVVIDTTVVLKINSGAKVDFQNRPVIIHSSAANTGMIGEITDGPSALLNATNVTIERFIPAKRSFRFLSPSVTTTTSLKANWMEGATNPNTTTRINPNPGYGTNITGRGGTTNGFDPTATNNPSLFTFNPSSQRWDSLPNTNGTLSAGSPYSLMVRGDRSIDMTTNTPAPTNTILRTKGTLFTGTFSPAISQVEGNYTFVGNPYASAIDWNALAKQDVSTTYYTWDPNLNVRGAYATYNGFYNTTVPTGSKIDQNIQPGQAFFVRTQKTNSLGSTSINPTLTIKEANKTSVNRRVFRPVSVVPKLSIQLLLNNEGGSEHTADAAVVYFDDSFPRDIAGEDSYKFTNIDENIAINHKGIALSIEGRPTLTSNDTIALKMWQLRQKTYLLKLDGMNFSSSVQAFLKDAYGHQETALNLSSVTLIPFTIDTAISASYATDRFTIVFKTNNTLPVTLTNVKAYQKSDGIQVDWTAHSEININRYELEKSADGEHFELAISINAKGNNATKEMYNWFDATAKAGDNFYRIKIVEKSGEAKYSEIINVKVSKENEGIIISPNPVIGNVINLRLGNIEKGKYSVTIYNNLAQKVYEGIIEHSGVAASYTIPGRKIPKGVYRLAITSKDKSITKTLIFK
ncbi:T9SS type A sorting domain-containing protein [Segetibacter koreensis]|uniref:T9SS type A sorting domain-containing protein n=1 Tax=Segetibacter koreensis TaxID=398037 RepID=UPI0003717C25|nr:T9SS type A sorting domain-containing protein [Segetibacter koreensis]